MIDDGDTNDSAENGGEAKRIAASRSIAAVAGIVSIVCAVVVFFLMTNPGRPRALALLEPLLALSLSTTLVAGARALDGPIRFGGRRREAITSSSAAALVCLWLGCFAAIETAFFVVDVAEKWEAGPANCSAVVESTSVMTVSDTAGTRTLALTNCGAGAKHPDDVVSEPRNGQLSNEVVVANGGDGT